MKAIRRGSIRFHCENGTAETVYEVLNVSVSSFFLFKKLEMETFQTSLISFENTKMSSNDSPKTGAEKEAMSRSRTPSRQLLRRLLFVVD
ncbi:hypothetical protein CCR75_007413 [Bremia lactucae]|uniref:Uncharacterized protein n=1 Tax=Bremia lactucae TaxID=4779 RepID=A0A976ILA9_BRELC|nr:hypothetical protein CCR75_007413 [Bremia lactucae]